MSTDLITGILTHQITQISTMCARGLLFSESLSHLWASHCTCMWLVPCRSIVGFYDAIKLFKNVYELLNALVATQDTVDRHTDTDFDT